MKPSNKPLVKPSLSRIIAHGRRLAAMHEAGHVTMARHLGAEVTGAWLEKIRDGDVRFQRQWIGHTSLYLENLSRKKKVMLAIAGAVAEYCWRHIPFDEAVDAWEDDPRVMSESDWAAAGCAPGNPPGKLLAIIEETFSLFDRETGILWPKLIKETRSLNSPEPPTPFFSKSRCR